MNLNTFKVRKEPRVIVKYDPIPFWAVKKMMRGNAASLMAGGEAVYTNFDTRLMSCDYSPMRGGWTSRAAIFIQEVKDEGGNSDSDNSVSSDLGPMIYLNL